MKIVLFEDDPATARKIEAAVKKHVPRRSEVLTFTPAAKDGNSRDFTYEKRLAVEVQSRGYGNATLWVTDRDLSKTSGYRGLSETNVSKAAAQLGIPICKYARGESDDDVFERQRSWGDAQIVLKSSQIPELGAKVAILATGFLAITNKLNALLNGKAGSLHTPAEIMAHILGRPESADQIALYGSGDQKMVGEILPFAANKRKLTELRERLPSVLGYWLYDSILRFPGLLLNSIAAASYLDIAVGYFDRQKVREPFSTASYNGPFEDPDDPHWWRKAIDDILHETKAKSGNDLVSQRLGKRVPHCLDSQTRERAGCYCMVKKVPVSEENSVGSISWFPPGADLARVRKDVYEQTGPWLGLF